MRKQLHYNFSNPTQSELGRCNWKESCCLLVQNCFSLDSAESGSKYHSCLILLLQNVHPCLDTEFCPLQVIRTCIFSIELLVCMCAGLDLVTLELPHGPVSYEPAHG